jgi:DNA-3-methyladenine glycosylase II
MASTAKTAPRAKSAAGSKPKRQNPDHPALAILKRDARMAAIIAQVGPYQPNPIGDGFPALVRAIVSQQVSKYAAEAILGRLCALFPAGRPDPVMLLKFRKPRLIGVGLSRSKVEYLRDLSQRVVDGQLDFSTLDRLSDEEIIAKLTAVKGIGRWTAEIYLLFNLGRPDVLPVGDAALVNAVRDHYALPADADHKHFAAIGENWRPWRSVAVWYLYRSINLQRAAARETARAAKAAAAA